MVPMVHRAHLALGAVGIVMLASLTVLGHRAIQRQSGGSNRTSRSGDHAATDARPLMLGVGGQTGQSFGAQGKRAPVAAHEQDADRNRDKSADDGSSRLVRGQRDSETTGSAPRARVVNVTFTQASAKK